MSYVMHVDVIASEERGITQNEWLNSRHTYSFGQYHNLKRLNFGTLRVFNEDIIEPGKGFATHSHDNMEIITIVLDGAIEHKDNAGHHGIIKAGDIQRMSAGSGIQHSEYNALKEKKVHFLQIWIYPEKRDIQPAYEQKNVNQETLKNTLCPIVTSSPSETALFIHQDAHLYMGHFEAKQMIKHIPHSKTHGDYLFVIEGEVSLGNQLLKTGDSAQITAGDTIEAKALEPSKILLIEVNLSTL